MSDLPYIIPDTCQQVGEHHGECIVRFNVRPELGKKHVNAEKLREMLVGMRIEYEHTLALTRYQKGCLDGVNNTIDEILNMIDEQKEGE